MAHYDLAGNSAAKVYIVAGLAILAFFSWKLYDDTCFLHKAIRGTGKIVFIERTKTARGSATSWIDVRYTTSQSQTVVTRFYDPRRLNYWHGLGDSVTFLYDPTFPAQARPAGMLYQYPWVWLLLMGSGIVLAWTGAKILWNAKR